MRLIDSTRRPAARRRRATRPPPEIHPWDCTSNSVLWRGRPPANIAYTDLMANEDKTTRTDEAWRQLLTPEQFSVLREHGTERAGTSPLNYEKGSRTFSCPASGQRLFSSDTTFE